MPKVSVIVPVYNVEKYLNKSLDSLVNQSLTDIEIILVNDGSTDNSLNIIKDYYKKYNNIIKYYTKENGGMSDARNYGMQKAKGEYISFVDSDDYIEHNMLYKMYNKAKEGNYDIVFCNTNIVYPDKTILKESELKEDKKSLTLADKNDLILNCYPVVWNKIYKKSFLDTVTFESDGLFKKGVWFEDVRMLYKMIPYVTSCGYVNEYFYNYIQHPKSITYTYSKRLYDVLENLDNIIDFYKSNNLYNDYKNVLEYIYVNYYFATFIKRLSKSKDKNIFNKGYITVKNKVNSTFPNYKENKYINKFSPKSLYLKHFNKLLANLVYASEKNKMN